MGEISRGSGISSIRGGDFELGANGVSAVASSDIVVEDITPLALMPLEDSLELVLGTGPATFTGSTTRTFNDRDDILVKTAAIDVTRFETNGVLMEDASTNLLLRSEEFDNASWGKFSGAAVAVNAAISPDGTLNADKLTFSTSTNSRVEQSVAGLTASNTYTLSCEAKSTTGDQTRRFGTSAATAGEFVDVLITSEWQRFAVTVSASSTTEFPTWTNNNDSASGEILIWGAQLEELPFASSYIKTTTTSVTKTLEDLDIASSNIPAPTVDYTVSTEVDILGLDAAKTQTVYSVDGEIARKIEINTTTGLVEATHGAVTSVSTTALVAGTSVKIAFVVDGTNQTLYIDGIQEDQDTKGTVTGTATAISIGNAAGLNQLFGHIKSFRIYDVALTSEQVSAL